TTAALSTLILGWLLALSPPDRDAYRPTYPEATETAEDRTFRYTEIAADIARAVEGMPEGQGRRGAAEILVAIGFHESGFAFDVDVGPCAPGRLRIGGCDGGRARSLWQLQAWEPDQGDGAPSQRSQAAREALRRAFRSLSACRDLAREERLAMYAGGS